jgi:peroxiredoxin
MVIKMARQGVLATSLLSACLLLISGCGRKQESSGPSPNPESDQPNIGQIEVSKLSRHFPSVLLKDLEGKVVPTDLILEGKRTVVMFISPTCSPCAKEIEKWKPLMTDLEPGYQVIGISPDPAAELSYYAKEQQINFPVYSDPSGALVDYFSLSTYPTLIGVTEQRIVKYIRPGHSARISPPQYLQPL